MTGNDRRAALIAAALADDLEGEERAEFERLAAEDPSMRTELAELREVLTWLGGTDIGALGLDDDPETEESDRRAAQALRARTLGALEPASEPEPEPEPEPRRLSVVPGAPASEHPTAQTGRTTGARPSRWRTRALAVAASAGLVLGVGGGYLVSTITAPEEAAPVTGPPGTLGAVETLSVPGVPTGSDVEAAFVAHTWGTETLLEIDGLDMGETYEVVLIGRDGTEFESGTFIATPERVVCRMNAAVLREDVQTLLIRDTEGHLDLTVDVPAVADS